MTRVSIAIDPMPALRQAARDRVNAAFSAHAAQSVHVDLAHAQKRLWATVNDSRLQPEACLRGITVEALAAMILSKPDDLAERELKRQAIMIKIDTAKTPAELEQI